MIFSIFIYKSKNAIIFSGSANKQLSEEIARYLGTKLGKIQVTRFSDGEANISVQENVRGKDIYIIQPTCPPVNENLVELLLMVSTLRKESARKINIVVPYYGYSRQDKKNAPRVPIAAADVARLLETVGVSRLIALDLHSGQIQGFFSPRVPVDNLETYLVALNYFKHQQTYKFKEVAIVSPDASGVARAKRFQEQMKFIHPSLDVSLAMLIRQKESLGKMSQMNLVGSVQDRDVIIIDDIIDSAQTLSEAAKVLKNMGANQVIAFASHALFTGKAFDNIENSEIDEIIVTNTVPSKDMELMLGNRIKRLSVAPLLAEAIYRIQMKESVHSLFKGAKES